MKNKLLLSLVPVLAFSATRAQGTFVIEGQIGNAPVNAVVNLYRSEGDMLKLQASDTITDGKFRFRGKTIGDGTEGMSLIVDSNGAFSMVLDVWVHPGSHIKVSSDNMLAYTWDVDSDVPKQQTRQKIVGAARGWWDKLQLNDLAKDSLRGLMRGEGLSPQKMDEIKIRLDSLENEKNLITDNIVLAETKVMGGMPVDDVWMDALLGAAYFSKSSDNVICMDAVIALYDCFPDRWKNTVAGAELGSIIYPPVQVVEGAAIADGELFDLTGGVHRLADFRGKYVLLDFWSEGCGPCILSVPELKEQYDVYKDSLEIVSLSLDTEEIWKQESPKHGMTWYNLNDLKGRSGIAAKYGVWGIPHYVLVSPQGILLAQWSGYSKGNLKENIGKRLGGM